MLTLALTGVAPVSGAVHSARVSGDVYYVRKSGNDSNDGLSPASAFRTVDEAADSVSAGDTVYVGAGTYDEKVKIDEDGTSSQPIRFIADTSGAMTGDAGEVEITQSNDKVLEVKGDYVEITGFVFSGGKGELIKWEKCVGGKLTSSTLDCGDCTGLKLKEADLVVSACTISNSHKESIEIDKEAELTILDSTITGSDEEGIKVKKDDSVLVMRRCYVIKSHKEGIKVERGTVDIVNCVIADGDEHGIETKNDRDITVRIYNSFFINNHKDGIDLEDSTATVVNCVMAHNGEYGISADEDATVTLISNIIYDNHKGRYDDVGPGSSDLFVDPMLGASPEYRPTAGSPVVDAGTSALSMTTVDIDGYERHAGAAWDIGPYEGPGAVSIFAVVTLPTTTPTTSSIEHGSSPLCADLNGDGRPDILFTGSAPQLLLQGADHSFSIGSFGFTEVRRQCGLADFDNDGDLDLWAANYASWDNEAMFWNSGPASFTYESGSDLSFSDPVNNEGILLADVDMDGWCDVLHCSSNGNFGGFNTDPASVDDPWSFPAGDSDALGIDGVGSYGNGDYVSSGDINDDGRADFLYHYGGGRLFLSQDDGTFAESPGAISVVTGNNDKFGSAWGDYDNDGDLDLFAARLDSGSRCYLFRQDSGGGFTDVASAAGLDTTAGHRSGCWGDFDNDGDLDLVVVGADDAPHLLYENQGDGTFTELDGAIAIEGDGSDACFADYDNDGDLDLLITRIGEGPAVLRNATDDDAYLKVRLVGAGERATNAAALGVRVELFSGATLIARRDVGAMRGFAGQEPLWLHFGGVDPAATYTIRAHFASSTIETAVVPGSASTSIGATTISQMVTITEPEPSPLEIVRWREVDPNG